MTLLEDELKIIKKDLTGSLHRQFRIFSIVSSLRCTKNNHHQVIHSIQVNLVLTIGI